MSLTFLLSVLYAAFRPWLIVILQYKSATQGTIHKFRRRVHKRILEIKVYAKGYCPNLRIRCVVHTAVPSLSPPLLLTSGSEAIVAGDYGQILHLRIKPQRIKSFLRFRSDCVPIHRSDAEEKHLQ